jgi:hypothetical protein
MRARASRWGRGAPLRRPRDRHPLRSLPVAAAGRPGSGGRRREAPCLPQGTLTPSPSPACPCLRSHAPNAPCRPQSGPFTISGKAVTLASNNTDGPVVRASRGLVIATNSPINRRGPGRLRAPPAGPGGARPALDGAVAEGASPAPRRATGRAAP